MYADGEGLGEDDATAVMWYTKAAEQGNAPAQYNLGRMYASGQGVTDDVTALMWFTLAMTQEQAGMKSDIDNLTKTMTAADISKAQALSRECLAQDYKNCGY
jgi:uncharacterized protein